MVTSNKPLSIHNLTGSKQARQRSGYKQKATMKSKFKRWIRNWINEEGQVEESLGSRLVESTELDSNQPMRITIHRAAGGMVIETRTYDRIKDRNNQNLHIVTHDQNLAESLSKIVTMESLRG